MLSLEAALEKLLAGVAPLPSQSVPLSAAEGRWLAREVVSPVELPPCDNSAMDGYALRSADVTKASVDSPVPLRCVGEAAAGGSPGPELRAGECRRIFTGGPLPPGADAVVMQEDTRRDEQAANSVLVLEATKPWENVRFRGEDVKAGARLAAAGTRLRFPQVALLAASGHGEVAVVRQPRVALLATGNELEEPGKPLVAGKIYESNRLTLAALVREAGGHPTVFPIVRDDPAATRAAVEVAAADGDVLITSGGVSVGEHDHVKDAFEAAGGRLEFWQVAMRPGKPFVCGRLRDRWFFGLPGNPVSCVVTFLLLVRPALIRLQGGTDGQLPVTRGTLAVPVANPGGRRHFVRVTMDDHGRVAPSGTQGSHMLSSLAAADGLLDVPAGAGWPPGRSVEVLRFP